MADEEPDDDNPEAGGQAGNAAPALPVPPEPNNEIGALRAELAAQRQALEELRAERAYLTREEFADAEAALKADIDEIKSDIKESGEQPILEPPPPPPENGNEPEEQAGAGPPPPEQPKTFSLKGKVKIL